MAIKKRAGKKAVKKSGKKNAPNRKTGKKKQAKKPVGRKAPSGGGGRARKKTLKARKRGAASGRASQVTSPDFGRPGDLSEGAE